MKTKSKYTCAYTLVEVLIGMSILSVAVGAATSLAATSADVEVRNREVGRAHSIIEAAHDLYQLGIAPSDISGILPYDPLVSIQFGSSNLSSTSLGIEAVSITGEIVVDGGENITLTIESLREGADFR